MPLADHRRKTPVYLNMYVENITLWHGIHSNQIFMNGETVNKKLLFRIRFFCSNMWLYHL